MMENQVSGKIIDAAYQVHTTLGPGLLESAYESVLRYELERRGLACAAQRAVPIVYDDIKLDAGFRLDLLVEEMVIVEVKSVEQLHPVHSRQLLTYLRLSNKRLGLLINFNVPLIKEGIIRIANGMP